MSGSVAIVYIGVGVGGMMGSRYAVYSSYALDTSLT